jgi:hypothetical protein
MERKGKIAIPNWSIISVEQMNKKWEKNICNTCGVFYYVMGTFMRFQCDFCIQSHMRTTNNLHETFTLHPCDSHGNIITDYKCCERCVQVFLSNNLSLIDTDMLPNDDFDMPLLIDKCKHCNKYYYYNKNNNCSVCAKEKGKYYTKCFIHEHNHDDYKIKCNCGNIYGVIQPSRFASLEKLERFFENFNQYYCVRCAKTYISGVLEWIKFTKERKDIEYSNNDDDYITYKPTDMDSVKKETIELKNYCKFFKHFLSEWPIKYTNMDPTESCIVKTRDGYCMKETDGMNYCNDHAYVIDYTCKEYRVSNTCDDCNAFINLSTHKCNKQKT